MPLAAVRTSSSFDTSLLLLSQHLVLETHDLLEFSQAGNTGSQRTAN